MSHVDEAEFKKATILASQIRPGLLDGLIPVDLPAFYDKRGDRRCVRSHSFVSRQVEWGDVSHRDFQVIADAVKALKEKGCEYIYWITWIGNPDKEDPGKAIYYVRGA